VIKKIPGKVWLILIVGVITLPVFLVFINVADVSAQSWYHLSQNLLPLYIKNTLLVVAGVALLSTLLGVSAAWWVTTRNFPGRSALEWLLILPLAIPTFISGITYSGLTDYTGPVRVLSRSAGLGDLPMDILNIPGVIFVMSVVLYPYVYLTARTAFLLQSATRIEAARMLGAGAWRAFISVALPMAWPGIFAGLTLVIMETLNDYGTVKYFGVSTFTTGIFKSWLSMGDMSTAVALFLMAFVVMILAVESKLRNRRSYEKDHSVLARTPLHGARAWVVAFCTALPFLLGFVIPVFQMLFWLNLSFDRINQEALWQGALGTAQVAFLSALLIVLIAWLFNFLQRFINAKAFLGIMNKLALLGYSMPGAVVGIGVVGFVLLIQPGWLFNTTIALMIGYLSRFFAVGHNPIHSGYAKIPRAMDESAKLLGRNRFTILSKIHWPLLKPALLAALVMIIIDIVKELPLTLILRPFNFQTLATQAFQFATDEMAPQSAAPSLLIILVSAVPAFFLYRLFGR